MRLTIALGFVVVAIGCSSVEPVAESKPVIRASPVQTTRLEHPLLTFEVVPIPSAAVAEEIAGDIKILRKEAGWIPLPQGTVLDEGSKVQLGAGAHLRIRFTSNERAELKFDKETWLLFERTGSR